MYQIKFDTGYEIRVIGKGEKGLCKVAKSTASADEVKFTGTYDECVAWLEGRNLANRNGQPSN